MRRFLQVFALLLVVLCGSLPGLSLLAPARAETCDCGMPAGTCPMKMPARSPGPTAPCNTGTTAPAFMLAAPCRLAQVQAPRRLREPSPFPQAARVPAARLLAEGPSVLARPGPRPPLLTCLTRLALLSVFRI